MFELLGLFIFAIFMIILFISLSKMGENETKKREIESIQLFQTITLYPLFWQVLNNKQGYLFYADKKALEEEFENYHKSLTMTDLEKIEYYENKVIEGKFVFIPATSGSLKCKVLDKFENITRTQIYFKVEIINSEHAGEVYWYAQNL